MTAYMPMCLMMHLCIPVPKMATQSRHVLPNLHVSSVCF